MNVVDEVVEQCMYTLVTGAVFSDRKETFSLLLIMRSEFAVR